MADIVPEALTFVGVSATALPSSHSLLVCAALAYSWVFSAEESILSSFLQKILT
jgi:uncharacterized protein YqgC (DUF456 family)